MVVVHFKVFNMTPLPHDPLLTVPDKRPASSILNQTAPLPSKVEQLAGHLAM